MTSFLDARNQSISASLEQRFDDVRFGEISTYFVILLGISFLYTLGFLHTQVNYSFFRVKNWLAWKWVTQGFNSSSFGTSSFIFSVLFNFFCILVPVGMAIAWIVVTLAELETIMGIVLLWACTTFFAGGYALLLWRAQAWRPTPTVTRLLLLSFATLLVLELFVLLTVSPFEYKSFTTVFLTLNAIPMVFVVYLGRADGGRIATDIRPLVHSPWKKAGILTDSSSLNIWFFYAASLVPLVVYAVLMEYTSLSGPVCPDANRSTLMTRDHIDGTNGYNEDGVRICGQKGWVAFANIVILLVIDLAYAVYIYAGTLTGPFKQAIVILLTRLSLIYFGDQHWFLGHCVAVFIASSNFLFVMIDRLAPAKGSLEQSESSENEVIDALLAKMATKRRMEQMKRKTHLIRRDFSATGEVRHPWLHALMTNNIVPVAVVYVLFCVEIVVVDELRWAEDVVIPLNKTPVHPFILGLLALIVCHVLPSLFATYRMLRNHFMEVNQWTLLCGFYATLFGCGSGVYVWRVSDSDAAFLTGLFVPFMLVCLLFGVGQWVKNDFYLRRPVTDDPDHEFRTDWTIIASGILFVLAGVWWTGLMFDLNTAPHWHLWTAATVFVVLLLNGLAFAKYFNTYQFDKVTYFLFDAGFMVMIAFCIGMYPEEYGSQENNTSLWLLTTVWMYPGVLLLIAALLRLYLDRLVLSKFSAGGILAGSVWITGLGVLLEEQYDETTWATGLFWLAILLVSTLVLLSGYNHDGFSVRPLYAALYAVWLVVLAAFLGRVSGTQDRRLGFDEHYHGWNLAGGAVAFYLLAYAAVEYYGTYASGRDLLYSRYIFPVFQLDPVRDTVCERSGGTAAVLVVLVMALVYGVMDLFYSTPLYRGFSIIGITVVLAFTFILDCLSRTNALLSAHAKFVPESFLELARRRLLDRELSTENPFLLGKATVVGQNAIPHWRETSDEVVLAVKAAEARACDTGRPEDYVHVLRLDRKLNERHLAEQRFRTHFVAAVVGLAHAFRRKREALLDRALLAMPLRPEHMKDYSGLVDLTAMARELTYLDADPAVIRGWTDNDVELFLTSFREAAASSRRARGAEGMAARKRADALATFTRRVDLENFADKATPPTGGATSIGYDSSSVSEQQEEHARRTSTSDTATSASVSSASAEYSEQQEEVAKAYAALRAEGALDSLYMPDVDAVFNEHFAAETEEGMVSITEPRGHALEFSSSKSLDNDVSLWKRFVDADTGDEYFFNAATGASVRGDELDESLAEEVTDRMGSMKVPGVLLPRYFFAEKESIDYTGRWYHTPIPLNLSAFNEAMLGEDADYDAIKKLQESDSLASACGFQRRRLYEGLEQYTDAPPTSRTFDRIRSQCFKRVKAFTDSSFIGDDFVLPRHAGCKWKRLTRMPSKDAPTGRMVLFDDVDPDDVMTGQIDNSWFMSAVAVAAGKPGLVASLFVEPLTSDPCLYGVRFYVNNQWVEVIVDDKVPVNKRGRPIYGRSRQPHEMWVSLIEKAFAKLHGGYQNIQGGLAEEALHALTGGSLRTIQLDDPVALYDVGVGHVFAAMRRAHEAGFVMATEARATGDSNIGSASGIVSDRAYAVLAVKEVRGRQLVKLKNPEGAAEWRGPFSDRDRRNPRNWSRARKVLTNHVFEDDGTFWMPMEDYVESFSSVSICRIFSRYNWNLATIHGMWTAENTFGVDDFLRNPTFFIRAMAETEVHVVMTHDAEDSGQNVSMCCTIMHGSDILHSSGVRRATRGQVVSSATVLPAATSAYTVIASASRGVQAPYKIKIYSNNPVTVWKRKLDVNALDDPEPATASMVVEATTSSMLFEPITEPSSLAGIPKATTTTPSTARFSSAGVVPSGASREYGYHYDATGHSRNNNSYVNHRNFHV